MAKGKERKGMNAEVALFATSSRPVSALAQILVLLPKQISILQSSSS